MSNVDSSSTNGNPRSLRNILLDLKSDLGLISESGQRVRKRFGEYIGSSSEFSGNSNSNFDEELSLMLKNTNRHGNLLDILNRKYLIGYAISEAFSGTDLDAYTLFHIWSTKRTSQKSLVLCDQANEPSDDNIELDKTSERTHVSLFVVFFQQLFYSRQSKLNAIDRTRPIFKIPPQDHSIVHAIEPKTTSLVLLSCIYGLKNIKFVGLRNHSTHARVPGPFLSLLSLDSKVDFMTCMNWIQDSVFSKNHGSGPCAPKPNYFGKVNESTNYSNFEGYLNISYFLHELDYIYSYILLHHECYTKYTAPILSKSFTGWTFGQLSLLLYNYRMRSLYKNVSLSEILSRLNVVLSLICKIFSEYRSSARHAPMDKCTLRGFNFYCFTSIVYSYLYAILSIPLELMPWENYVFDKPEPTRPTNTGSGENSSSQNHSKSTEMPLSNSSASAYNDDVKDLGPNYNIINMSVHNEFAETAADSTCVENTRRHDNLMSYVIGIVNGEGNWIKRKEKFVDVIDTYKLNLSWYRRPSFSNTLYNTSYKAWPIALYYYNLLIEPCGRAFFVWYWKNIEAWSSSNIWAYRVKRAARKRSLFSQFLHRLSKKDRLLSDSNLQLKRQVSLRLRDTVSFIFDMELELKKALLYS
ncbi:conserved hypothetical protein [Theileria orientalis strain Shintoku]|uniref:Uncharacterized protein n=1 Tax=Theileria orientalis strain Shintoku TaxID=869250 RepID=J7MC73_THEOR|nr:conserved hypothetical protein [Theileria orientalis strain Shintoku]BAM42327.1 conserved hypothetical protein [Theileria orientalis strain Shintoku]|eukprot:XP_009692628.1 conserved hypothetical protein [Theileria orientalis strain Shintoku]